MSLAAPAPEAEQTVTAVLGPTNTGKTHYAIERMLARADGIIGLPLRLLAREVYDKVVDLRGPGSVALITGEEKILPKTARYFICTVEAMPLDRMVDFVAIDEVQMCADPERGHVFTDRVLNARGRYETLFLGSDAARPRIANLVPKARFTGRERFSTLTYAGQKKISRLKPRSAVVAFSIDQVYAIAELIRRQRGGAAVVMGALSPRTRNAQVALYQQGDVDYLVATDAIGMGLNLDIDHIAFAGLSKFDGHQVRRLQANELAQIAGRAGRHIRDGTFGVTGEAPPIEPEIVDAIEAHRFKPIARLMWRNSRLDFGSVPGLLRSLETAPESPDLARAREAEDQATLRGLWEDREIRAVANRPDRVRLLWDVCQVPDFRKVANTDHTALVGRIYRFLLGPSGCIPSDWIAGQVRRIDRTDGDIDALAKRLAYIRTWTYVANRVAWVEDAPEWQATTRAVEDRLSDALHARLTQRFVDRRTSVLMRRLKQKERLVAEVNDKGEVTVEGEYLGRIDGFCFTVDETATPDEIKTLRSASLGALQGEFARRADRLYLAPDTAISMTEQGGLVWDEAAVGKLVKGDELLAPRAKAFVDDTVEPAVVEKIERRLMHWVQRRIAQQFEPLIAMRDDETVTGLARGVAFQLVEQMGVIPRRQISEDVKALAQEERALLRKHGVRFGQHTIFLPLLLKPKPTQLRLLLWALTEGLDEIPSPPPPGHVTVPKSEGMPQGYWDKAGYKLCGTRAVRIDMLERLADMIRPMDAKAGFEATPDMLSITGCTLEQFAEIMNGLGFQGERGERPKTPRAPAKPEPAPKDGAAAEGVAPETPAPAEGGARDETTVSAPVPATAAPGEAAVQPPETAAQTAPDPQAPANTAPEPNGAAGTAPAEADSTGGTSQEPPGHGATSDALTVAEDGTEASASNAQPTATEPAGTEASGTEASGTEPSGTEASATEPSDPARPAQAGEAATVEATATTETAATPAPTAAETSETEVFYLFTVKPRRPAGGAGKRRRGPPGAQPGSDGRSDGRVEERADGNRPPRGDRPERGDRSGRGERSDRPPRGPRQDRAGDGGGRDRPDSRPRRADQGQPAQGQTTERTGSDGSPPRAAEDARPARQGQGPHAGKRAEGGNRGGQARGGLEAGAGPRGDGAKNKGKGRGKGKPPRNEEWQDRPPRQNREAREEKPIDPDSPFAILQKLKNR